MSQKVVHAYKEYGIYIIAFMELTKLGSGTALKGYVGDLIS